MSALPTSQTVEKTDANANLSALLESLVCPSCKKPAAKLSIAKYRLTCELCKTKFPVFENGQDSVPWLYADPDQSLIEWKARLNGFLHLNHLEQRRLSDALKDKHTSKTGHERINRTLQAKIEHKAQILELISPLKLESKSFEFAVDAMSAFHSKVPKVQGLSSYYNNIFRDWCWDNSENEQLLEAVESTLLDHQHLGRMLTIGAGAGRLSYDMHRKYVPDMSILLDINPLLLFASSSAIQGKKFSLYEFPIAPLNKDSFAVLQNCQAPNPTHENIIHMFADGLNAPFKAQSFNTVLTPWLIDIIPQNLCDFIPRINQLLKIGGQWINTGSLAFFHKDPAWCYSEEEVFELLEKYGFESIASNRKTIQYLNSPISAHGRTEELFSFCVKKVKDVASPPKYDYLPAWIHDVTQPIPGYHEHNIESSKHLLQAQVIGAIDGNRSIEQIGLLIAKQYSLQVDEAIHAVRRIAIDLHESTAKQ